MNCSTHNDIAAVAFCRSCGKPLCANCTRDVRGVVYCEPCLAARLEGTAPPAAFVTPVQPVPPQQTFYPVVAPAVSPRVAGSGPNPAVAGILGAIPFGIGAVYNGQYSKGLVHMFIFGLLIYGANHAGRLEWLFGVAIPFFVVYQIIEAVRTAKALQAGQPAPDPFGLAQTFSMGEKGESKNIPAVAVILIGLGVLFLLHTMNVFEFGLDRFWPLILIFFGGWMLAKQWGMIGGGRVYCACDRCRMRKLMGPAVLITVGILFLLQSLNVVDFDRTWPAILLVVGVVKLLQSNASSVGHREPLQAAPVAAAPPPQPTPPSNPPPATAGTAPSSGEVSNG